MLKTITKFVGQRRRLVISDNSRSSKRMDSERAAEHSNVPPQLAEPQLGEPSAPRFGAR